ncbi:replication-relaxation family protein [Streptomyces sp. A1136]|uniref:replication-relaxation family protein n=1 Tax=Streptomyces sp. A1136 TaxID=2563102 RepID=UPI002796330F|nr:replication-relaxation family protein [Streptomyces sp. A1136]
MREPAHVRVRAVHQGGERLHVTGGEDRLIADAVLHYTATRPRRLQYRAFVEIDRATMSSERLARKLITYARFHDYTPQPIGRRGTVADQAAMLAWQRTYPRFPRILFILTGAPHYLLGGPAMGRPASGVGMTFSPCRTYGLGGGVTGFGGIDRPLIRGMTAGLSAGR